MRRLRFDNFTWFLVALTALGAGSILLRQVNHGVGIELDSTIYISVARNFLDGHGFVQWLNKEPYLFYPPLYPAVLVGASLFAFDPHTVAGPVNAAIFGLTIFIGGRWLRRRIESRFLSVWGCLALALSPPLAAVAYTAMSESLFILFVIVSLIYTHRFLEMSSGTALIWASVFAALACSTRYVGVTLIMATLPLLLLQRGPALGAKMKQMAAYALITSAPLCLWMLRNVLITENSKAFSGHRGVAVDVPRSPEVLAKIVAIASDRLNGLGKWGFLDLPMGDFRLIVATLTGVSLLALTAYLIILFCKRKMVWNNHRPFQVFGTFAVVYFASLLVISTVIYVDKGNRHLAVMYIPLLFTAILALDRFLSDMRPRTVVPEKFGRNKLLPVILSAVLGLWLCCLAVANVRAIKRAHECVAPSVAIAKYAESAVFRYMRQRDLDGALVSNVWQGHAYWYTRATDFFLLATQSGDCLRRFIDSVAGDVYVAWFYRPYRWNHEALPIEPHLDALPKLKLVASLSDGVIFKVDKARGNADD